MTEDIKIRRPSDRIFRSKRSPRVMRKAVRGYASEKNLLWAWILYTEDPGSMRMPPIFSVWRRQLRRNIGVKVKKIQSPYDCSGTRKSTGPYDCGGSR